MSKNPFVCPECGNDDPKEMNLLIVDNSWERYRYTGTDDGVPIFTHSKSVYAESSDDHDPTMECRARKQKSDTLWWVCRGEWKVEWDDFDLG